MVEGCGYCAVELRVKGVSLLLLSLYLKTSTPLHCHPNAEILASVVALIKDRRGQWLVAGDFNLSPQELVQTCFGGGVRWSDSLYRRTYGSFKMGVSSSLADWSAPHRPRASVLFEVRLPGSQERSLKLPDFQVRDACEDCRLPERRPGAPEVCILGTNFSSDWISGEFGAFSQWFQEAMYPDEKSGLGRSLAFHRAPSVPAQLARSYCTQAGFGPELSPGSMP